MEKANKKTIIKILKFIMMIIWMIVVFIFSNQPGTVSSNTSAGFTQKIIKTIMQKKDFTDEEKNNITQRIEPVMRKIAHYTLYTIGGILIMNVVYEYKIKKNKEIIVSLIIGNIYSITDEVHQYFIDGRSASVLDIGIDTLGVITGIFICLLAIKIFDFYRSSN